MTEPTADKKRVDESWKEQVEREKQSRPTAPGPEAPRSAPQAEPPPAAGGEDVPQARFDLFISGLAVEALIALGDMAHPTTRRQSQNLEQAKYLIDLLGVLEEKTAGNLSVDEQRLLRDTLYQLRMRYLNKSGGVAPA
jgi:hypothetical protein